MKKNHQTTSDPVQHALACQGGRNNSMATQMCLQVFQTAQDRRIHRPLTAGRYKLTECSAQLASFSAEIQRIRDFICKRESHWSFRHCTQYDKHIWLQKLPVNVAHRLGHDYLPALQALAADGVPPTIVRSELAYATLKCHDLIQRLEAVRIALCKSIDTEYQSMRLGGSLIEPLISEAMELTQKSLSLN